MTEGSGMDDSEGGRSTGGNATNGAAHEAPARRGRSRRTFLRGVGVAGAATVGLATVGSDPAAAFHGEYDTVVDVVEAGADNTGGESITPVLEDHRADDTAFVFPEGRYYMDSQFRFTGFDNVGFFGQDATLVPADYHAFDGPQFRLFRLGVSYSPGRRLRFEGFDVDQTASDTGIRTIEATVSQHLEVRDVTIHGEHDSGTWGPGMFAVSDPDGSGVVERFRAPDGGLHADWTPNAGNMWRGPIGIEANTNVGHLEFRDCELGGFPDNGLYAVNDEGTIVVDGGRFVNSNGASVRLGGQGSEIRGATVAVDRTRSYDDSQRGIRLEHGDDLQVTDVDISITSPKPTSHAISVMNSCQSSRIEETSIEIRGDRVNHGIVVSPEAGETYIGGGGVVHEAGGGYPLWITDTDRRDRVLVELFDVSGEAGVTSAGFRDGIRCERDNCRFSHVTVDQPGRNGADRNGIVISGDETTVYKGTFHASQYPYIDQGDGNHLRNSETVSYEDGLEGVRLYPGIEGPEFRVNRIVNGIDDLGASNVLTWENTYE
ncbi:right-handed parallel beta-helix repeat-containing protein [Natronobacterium lacisalsi]